MRHEAVVASSDTALWVYSSMFFYFMDAFF